MCGSLPCIVEISTYVGVPASPRCQATRSRPCTDWPMTRLSSTGDEGFAAGAASRLPGEHQDERGDGRQEEARAHTAEVR